MTSKTPETLPPIEQPLSDVIHPIIAGAFVAGRTGGGFDDNTEHYSKMMLEAFTAALEAAKREAEDDGYQKGILAAIDNASKVKFALIINRSSSKCGRCDGNADPHEKTHILGKDWGDNAGKGCGVYWRYLTSEYAGMDEAITDMRPDLELIRFHPPLVLSHPNQPKNKEK